MAGLMAGVVLDKFREYTAVALVSDNVEVVVFNATVVVFP
jgi:hypothetical protein